MKIKVDRRIKYNNLPINMLVNKDICEKIMLEYVNESDKFLSLSNYQKYKNPISESNNECDCISEKYSLDFKRFGSYSYYQSLSELKLKKYELNSGISFIGRKSKLKEMNYLLLDNILSDISIRDIYNIRNNIMYEFINDNEYNIILNKEVDIFIKSISKYKHILILYNYMFFYDDDNNKEIELNILDIMNNRFNGILEYREKEFKNCDTYVSYFANEKFNVLKFNDQCISIFDSIDINKSCTYMKYKDEKYIIKKIKL